VDSIADPGTLDNMSVFSKRVHRQKF